MSPSAELRHQKNTTAAIAPAAVTLLNNRLAIFFENRWINILLLLGVKFPLPKPLVCSSARGKVRWNSHRFMMVLVIFRVLRPAANYGN